jgi:Tol biopolymer transport system component
MTAAVLAAGFATEVCVSGAPASDDAAVDALAKEVGKKGWIVYSRWSKKADMDLFTVRPDGSDERRITETRDYHEGAPRFSNDSKKLLYRKISTARPIHHNRWGYQGRIVIANPDGSEPKELGKDGDYPWACWSPDGKAISCLTPRGIKVVDIATEKTLRTLPRKGMYQQLFWSPDGKWFCGVTNAFGEMWTVARLSAETGEINGVYKFSKGHTGQEKPTATSYVDRTGQRRTFHGAECTPDWFPDSKRILFSHHPGRWRGHFWTQLWMANGDGTDVKLVYAEKGRHIYGGIVSPDAKYILFARVMLDGAGGLISATRMGVMRLSDAPIIKGKLPRLRAQYPKAKDGPVVDLPVGYEPDWSYVGVKPES